MERLKQLVAEANEKSKDEEKIELAPIEVNQGDLLETEWWRDADIVYSSSVCFPEFLNEGIAQLSKKLKPGARLISLQLFQNETPHLDLVYTLKIKMTWGHQYATMYVRNNKEV